MSGTNLSQITWGADESPSNCLIASSISANCSFPLLQKHHIEYPSSRGLRNVSHPLLTDRFETRSRPYSCSREWNAVCANGPLNLSYS